MENFKVKNRLVYGGYIALLWLLGGLAFYYILNIITQSPEDDSSLLCLLFISQFLGLCKWSFGLALATNEQNARQYK